MNKLVLLNFKAWIIPVLDSTTHRPCPAYLTPDSATRQILRKIAGNVLLALMLAWIAYFWSHQAGVSAAATASHWLAVASGIIWALSATLPARHERWASKLNFVAACLAAMSGACILP